MRLTGRTSRRLSAALATLTLAVALAPAAAPIALADDVTQNDIDRSKASENATSVSIADLESQVAQLNVDLRTAQVNAASANEDYLLAVHDLDTATAEAETAQQNAETAAADVSSAREDLGAVVSQTYEEGSTGPVDSLTPYLTSESLSDLTDNDVALERAGDDTDPERRGASGHGRQRAVAGRPKGRG